MHQVYARNGIEMEEMNTRPTHLRRRSLLSLSICGAVSPCLSRSVLDAPCSSSSEAASKFLERYAMCRAGGAKTG